MKLVHHFSSVDENGVASFFKHCVQAVLSILFHLRRKEQPLTKKSSQTAWGGYSHKKMGRGVWPASQNPYPIYDQKSAIFPTLFMT